MKKIVCGVLILSIICGLVPISGYAAIDHELIKKNMEKWNYVQFDQGSGTKKDPYIIDEIEDLEFMADTVFRVDCTYKGKYFRLTKDLYLNDITKPIREWKGYFPIGWDDRPFEGHFDGGGHTIYGYKALVVDYNKCKGLFGFVRNGSIKNLTMSDSYFSMGISDGLNTSILVKQLSCGDGESASVENCHSVNPRGSISNLISNVFATNGGTVTIKNCTGDGMEEAMVKYITACNDALIVIDGLVRNPKVTLDEDGEEQITPSKYGIIETLYSDSFAQTHGQIIIENCINNCPAIDSSFTFGYSNVDRGDYRGCAVGGILNCSFRKTTDDIIRNCTNNSIVYGIGGIGGIVGVFMGEIENCVNNGKIYGMEARVGGIVGQHTAGNIVNCANKNDINVVDTDILIAVIRFGGIAGVNNGVIESCINYGDINGSPMGSGTMEMGGIVGRGSYIYNCANLGNLVGITASSGGVAGSVALNVPEAVADNCYNAGNVSASPLNSGSVIGISQSPTMNCYYLSGTHQFGRYTDKAEEGFDLPDYKALSYDEMVNPDSFASFDFKNKWIMPSEKGFPIPRGSHFGDIAIPKETEIDVNGKTIKLWGYNVNDNNYYKLRDVALLLSGTKSGFSVDWDSEEETIVIKTKSSYTPTGNENKLDDRNERAVEKHSKKVLLNKEPIELKTYEIDGSNYFTIREVAEIIGFKVDWDEKEERILVKA